MVCCRAAEHLAFDTNWKVTRGRSVMMEGYKDEIATSKPKPARTLVHKLQWLPYGERAASDAKRSGYASKLNALLKTLLSSASGSQLARVGPCSLSSEPVQDTILSVPHLNFGSTARPDGFCRSEQVKALVAKLGGKPLTAAQKEALTSVEGNKLASVFADVFGAEEPAEDLQAWPWPLALCCKLVPHSRRLISHPVA